MCYDIYVNFKGGRKLRISKLNQIAEIYQGNILTRIKPANKLDEVEFDSISMQELSYYVGIVDNFDNYAKSKVSSSKLLSCIFTKQQDVVVGLSSRKAMVIEENRSKKLLLSNFALVRVDVNKLDPYYFCWLFNENLQFQKLLEQKVQGSANVSILPIKTLKELELELPNIDIQRKVGLIYDLYRRRERLNKQIMQKEKILMNYQLNKINKL